MRPAIQQPAFALLVLAAGCGIQLHPVPGGATDLETVHSIEWEGRTRTFRVYVPSAAAPGHAGPRPLVFAFHGWGGNAAGFSRLTGLSEVAERNGFVVVYPEGLGGNWNDGRPGINPTVDDLGFIAALMDDMRARHDIDPRRVYATGLSNGGHMSNRLAIELSDRIAAIAPVAALVSRATSESSTPGRAVPVMLIVGDSDPIMPYAGGVVRAFFARRGEVLSASEVAAFWIRRNLAQPAAIIHLEPDRNPGDGTRARTEMHPALPGTGGAEFVLVVVLGGGHTWPGANQYLSTMIFGRTCRDFSGSELIWEFLSRNALPE